jgi:hypothetical protein
MKTLIGTLMALLAATLLAGPAVAADQRPIVLEFDKQWAAPDYYVGTITGGGTITMSLYDKSIRGNTQHFSATVEINIAEGSSIAAVHGAFNFSTGKVVLTGAVTSGWLAGARVLEESQLVDVDTFRFLGSVQLMPASASD